MEFSRPKHELPSFPPLPETVPLEAISKALSAPSSALLDDLLLDIATERIVTGLRRDVRLQIFTLVASTSMHYSYLTETSDPSLLHHNLYLLVHCLVIVALARTCLHAFEIFHPSEEEEKRLLCHYLPELYLHLFDTTHREWKGKQPTRHLHRAIFEGRIWAIRDELARTMELRRSEQEVQSLKNTALRKAWQQWQLMLEELTSFQDDSVSSSAPDSSEHRSE